MRIRNAKRLSSFKYRRAEIPFDYWLEIQPYKPILSYHRETRTFKCVINTGCAKLVRVHTCAYQLFRIVAHVVVDNYVTKFQRQPVVFRPMSNPLSKAAADLIEERGLHTTSVYGYRHFRPQPLSNLQKAHPDVESAIASEMEAPYHLPQSLIESIKGYQHSSTVKDLDRVAPGLVCLGALPPRELDYEVAWDLFVEESLTLPAAEDGDLILVEVPEFTVVEMSRQPQTTSASGLMALSIQDGCTVGSKKTMHDAAIAINLQDKLGTHIPPLNPAKPALKPEVIKVGKDVRAILLESQPNYMVLKHYFGSLASRWADFAGGVAIGMSNRRGDFKAIPYGWWQESDLEHDEFLDWLSTQSAHESDKTKWESSTNATDGYPFIIGMLMRVNIVPADRRLVLRALADYVRPHVQFDVGKVYSAPWRVPSGSYLTAYGNSKRHKMMANWVITWLAEHGSAGSDNCPCPYCTKGRGLGLIGWGRAITDQEFRMLKRFHVMGDDFLALNPVPHVFDWLLDEVFGTTTKTVVRPFFSEAGLVEPLGAEFLRRHFSLDRSVSPHVVRTFRAPGRLLGKLFNGGHRCTKERFLAAIDSALNDVGANYPLFKILYNLHHVIIGGCDLNLSKYRDALQQYVRKNPLIEFMALGYVPSYSDLLNLDANILDPLVAVKRSDAARAVGMTPAMYLEQC